jgi:hypothetical protein
LSNAAAQFEKLSGNPDSQSKEKVNCFLTSNFIFSEQNKGWEIFGGNSENSGYFQETS